MSKSHANLRFKVFGHELKKLYNDRYQIVVRCFVPDRDSEWFYANREYFWKNFADLYTAPLEVDGVSTGWTVAQGEAYPDMRLVATDFGYIPQQSDPFLTFVYETLTSNFVQDRDEKVDYEENGLRKVTRTVIAEEGSTYGKTVGTSTISHSALGYAGIELTLASATEIPKNEGEGGFTRLQETWLESGILSVRTPKVGGQQQVVISAFNMSESEVSSELSSVLTIDHTLVDVSESDYEGIKTSNYTFEVTIFEFYQETENGLRQLTRTSLSAAAFSRGNVGEDTFAGLTLAGETIDNGNALKKQEQRFAEPGILSVDKRFENDLLYVTFESQGTKFTPTLLNDAYSLTDDPLLAFQGGDPAVLFRDRRRNVNGFVRYIITVIMTNDGAALTDDTEVSDFTTWDEYNYPGYVDASFDDGIVPHPGGPRAIKVRVQERLNKTGSVGTEAPFSIKEGCWVKIRYIPDETGLAESTNKAFGVNFLAGAVGFTGSNTEFMGMPVSSAVAEGGSDPTHAQFLGNADYGGTGVRLEDPILSEKIIDEFTTDEGETWYRIRKVTLDGKFGDY